jgi:hypothetical protein
MTCGCCVYCHCRLDLFAVAGSVRCVVSHTFCRRSLDHFAWNHPARTATRKNGDRMRLRTAMPRIRAWITTVAACGGIERIFARDQRWASALRRTRAAVPPTQSDVFLVRHRYASRCRYGREWCVEMSSARIGTAVGHQKTLVGNSRHPTGFRAASA